MSQKVGVIGSGVVGKVLAAGFIKHGREVMVGSRSAEKLAELRQEVGDGLRTGSFVEAAGFGQIVVLAVKGTAAEAAIAAIGAENLAGKVVIDATNPIADAPPQEGVLQFFTGPNESLMERLQRAAPKARFVKAWSCVGNAFMVDPQFPGGPPTMFICGDDADAKRTVAGILGDFGWAVADMGAVQAARAIEPLCQLWCIPGLRENRWGHAFKQLELR
jgi:8-hydroxy-5-deazaflavin:NADPH oxidoreductase